jgi:phytoene synthase
MHRNNKVSQKNGLSFCGAEVRAHDPDRFLISLAFPPAQRAALWALFAFNYEIAKTRDVVSEPTLGHIRLQWWREGVEALETGEERPRHEVLAALAPYALPQAELKALVDARDFDLEGRPPATLDELRAYAVATAVPLARLAARLTGADPDESADAAIAYSLAGLLRAVPAFAVRQRCLLPADLMVREGFTEYDLFAHKAAPEALARVVEAVAACAPAARPQGRYLRACACMARLYLKQLARAGWNPFAAGLAAPPFLFPVRVLWASH